MLVSPLPGASRDSVRSALRDLCSEVSGLRAPSPDGSYAWLVSYLGWVIEAARMLRSQVNSRDIDRLVLTRRYELLLSMTGRAHKEPVFRSTGIVLQPQPKVIDPVLDDLLSTELEERVAAFEEANTALNQQIGRWSRLGTFVVLDTSVYLTQPEQVG